MGHAHRSSAVTEALFSPGIEETQRENICKNQNYPQLRYPTRNSNQKTGATFLFRMTDEKEKEMNTRHRKRTPVMQGVKERAHVAGALMMM